MEHERHPDVRSRPSLTRAAIQATLHCLTGCAIGEILGMVLATALGLANAPSIALSIALAFVFGYGLTLRPVVRAGVPFSRAIRLAFASDTVSIATMEVIDNAFIALVPGALAAGLVDGLLVESPSESRCRVRPYCAGEQVADRSGPRPRCDARAARALDQIARWFIA